MRYIIISVFLGLFFISAASAEGDEDFSVGKIAPGLLEKANAVIRMHSTVITINAANEIVYEDRYAVTVLNEKGREYADIDLPYDKFIAIRTIKGWLYDGEGRETASLKKNEIKDIAGDDEYFFDDDRRKTFSFHCNAYPYTCVYEIERKCSYSLIITPWMPVNGYDCALEAAEISVTYPGDFRLRYRTFHVEGTPSASDEDGREKLTFRISNICAKSNPDALTPFENFPLPTMIMAMDHFAIEDQDGSMDTWQNFGKFFYDLNSNRDQLPPDKRKIVHELTDTCRTEFGKIRALYHYLQQNTRYVCVSLGIGGWQTFDANYVAAKGYGDCKALSNYMKALLREAGIIGYVVLVDAGEKYHRTMMPDFVYNVFDHVVLCVPHPDDTVWIECTSGDLPAGYLSSFTMNRNALMLTPGGGVVVRTPSFAMEKNSLSRCATVSVNDIGDLTANIKCVYNGYWWDKESQATSRPKSTVENYFNRKFPFPTYKVRDFNIDNVRSYDPKLTEKISVSGRGNISARGNTLFLSPAVFRNPADQPQSSDTRTDSFQITHSFCVSDSVTFLLVSPRNIENNTKSISLEFPFGRFHTDVTLESDSVLKVKTYYEQRSGIYAPALYPDLVNFSKAVNSFYSSEKIILTKK